MAQDVGIWHRLLRSWTELYMSGRVSKPTFDAMNEFIAREYPPTSSAGPPFTVLARLQAAVEQYLEQPELIKEEG